MTTDDERILEIATNELEILEKQGEESYGPINPNVATMYQNLGMPVAFDQTQALGLRFYRIGEQGAVYDSGGRLLFTVANSSGTVITAKVRHVSDMVYAMVLVRDNSRFSWWAYEFDRLGGAQDPTLLFATEPSETPYWGTLHETDGNPTFFYSSPEGLQERTFEAGTAESTMTPHAFALFEEVRALGQISDESCAGNLHIQKAPDGSLLAAFSCQDQTYYAFGTGTTWTKIYQEAVTLKDLYIAGVRGLHSHTYEPP